MAKTPIDTGHLIGSIQQSILTEAQFQQFFGEGWVLMDGRNVSGSRYHSLTGNNILPDARGQFLRGKNNGRSDGNEDPAGERSLGNQQEDAMQGHKHEVNTLNAASSGNNQYNPRSMADGWYGTAGDIMRNIISDGVNGTPRTANETRVKNIAVNIFIKIN